MRNQRFTAALTAAIGEIQTAVQNDGYSVSDQVAKGTYSQEGIEAFATRGAQETEGVARQLATILGDLDPQFENIDAASLESSESMKAGVIAFLAAKNPSAYHSKALKHGDSSAISLESIYSGIGGEIDVAGLDQYSQESFDETELNNFAAQNIVYNILASRQDAFAEAFFPTKVISPAEGGLSITVDQQEAIELKQHGTTGARTDVDRRRLIDAYSDHRILARPATKLVPYAREDNSADASFVAEADVPAAVLDVNGTGVRTRPLKMGQQINLLGLSQAPGTLNGETLDNTDQIAPGMKLNQIFVKLDDGTDQEVLALTTSSLSRNQFRKSHEGQGREIVLNFITSSLVLDKNTKTVAGVDSALLAGEVATPNLVVRLSVSVNGNGNVDSGMVNIHASKLAVESVVDENGEEIALDAGAGKAVVDRLEALKTTVFGYTLDARRSNSNWRSTGTIIDVTPYKESYAVEPGYPITVLTPTEENQHGAKISGMVNAARIRNSNNAVTMLMNYAEQLQAFSEALARGVRTDLLGAGRHIVKPFFIEDEVDVADRIVVQRSGSRSEDVSRVIVDAIRDVAFKMYRDSNYGPALDLATGGTAAKPKLLIGCDVIVERWLNITADDRLMGGQMDYEIVSTNDQRLKDTIYLTFTRNRPGSDDGLSFGVHAYMPELIQRVTTNRGGSTAKNDRVIPRSIHVPVLPVLAKLNVVKLKEAVTNTTP